MPGQRMFGVSPTSDSGTGGWVHADPPSPRAVADAEELPSTLLMIGETGDQPNSDLWGVRLAGPVPVDGAPARVEALPRFAIVCPTAAARLTDAAFPAPPARVPDLGCGLWFEATLGRKRADAGK